MRGPAAEEEEEDFEEENSTCCPGCCDGEMSVEGTVSGMSRLAIILCFPTPQTSCCSLISWIVGCANFSAQYNYNSITLAILMLERAGKDVPTWATSSLTSVIFLGSVFGQLCLGFLGDAVGRGVGLALTLVLIIGGAFLSSAAWDYETEPSTSV
ncbi:Inorganic phosphate transporter [Aureococcus anophagefferens]|nr:Inorganic phosphate transporter [Aureococcus anophagefferens]